jgi:hypothetical protein
MSKTIGMRPLRDFLKYVIYTGFVRNIPYPVSALIIAPPEHAKSTEAQKFECLGVMQVDKTTAYGLADIINNMSKRELEQYHHFIILDLENYASMGREVREQFLAFLRQTTQEGIKLYHTAKIDLNLDARKSFGFIMCTTPEDLGDKRSVFRSLSFLDRPLPYTYKYSDFHRKQILDFIADEEHNAKETITIKREEKEDVTLPKHLADELNVYALILAKRIEKVASHPKTVFKGENELCGIRAKENLMSLVKAIALYNGGDTVTREDMKELNRLYNWMNYNFKPLEEE